MATVKKLFSIDENIARELEFISDAMNKTQKEVLESALDFYFDYTDTIVADKVTKDILNKDMEVYDADDVYKELGIEL